LCKKALGNSSSIALEQHAPAQQGVGAFPSFRGKRLSPLVEIDQNQTSPQIKPIYLIGNYGKPYHFIHSFYRHRHRKFRKSIGKTSIVPETPETSETLDD